MDDIKNLVSSFVSTKQVRDFLVEVSAICKEKNAELKAKEKAASAELRKVAAERATESLSHTPSGSTVKVLFKKEPIEVEFIEKKDGKFVVKMNGKKRQFPYHQLVV